MINLYPRIYKIQLEYLRGPGGSPLSPLFQIRDSLLTCVVLPLLLEFQNPGGVFLSQTHHQR